jgi:hypothetical protein
LLSSQQRQEIGALALDLGVAAGVVEGDDLLQRRADLLTRPRLALLARLLLSAALLTAAAGATPVCFA